MGGIVKTIFWSDLAGVLIVIGMSIGLGVILYHYTTVYHIMKILQVFSIAVLGIMCLGILFKTAHKRTVIFPLLVFGATFIVQNLTDNLPTVTHHKPTTPEIASYKNKEKIFQNTKSDILNDSNFMASSDSEIIPTGDFHENPLEIITEEPISAFKIDKNKTTAYANIRRYLAKNKLPPKNSIQVEEIINYFPYDYALPETKEQPFVLQTTLTQSPWRKDSKLLHIGIKGYEQETEKHPIADDTKIQVEFNSGKVAKYRLIGYKTHFADQENLTENQIDAGEVNTGDTITAIYEITPTEHLPLEQSDKIALVRVSYKLPGETDFETIEQAVSETTDLNNVSDDVRFAIAVAGFGEKLKGSQSVNWAWKDIRNFAKSAQNKDKNRQEFIALIKKAEDLIKAEKYDPNC